jgi:SAM-dependent methyltransferase
VLLDRYVDATHAGQRSGRAAARVLRPLFDADAAAMPFADQVFDYAICSHVLEHVPDPAAVIAELTRVAKAGYIEVPEAASAKILDFPSHLWWCRLDGSTLVFTAKHARHFDPEIGEYVARAGIERRLADLLDSEFDHRIVSLRWSGSVDVKVEGVVDPVLWEASMGADAHHRVGQSLLARVLTLVFTIGKRRRRTPIPFDDIVAPALRRGTGETLSRQVYRLGSDS